MRKLLIVPLVLLLVSAYAYAQIDPPIREGEPFSLVLEFDYDPRITYVTVKKDGIVIRTFTSAEAKLGVVRHRFESGLPRGTYTLHGLVVDEAAPEYAKSNVVTLTVDPPALWARARVER